MSNIEAAAEAIVLLTRAGHSPLETMKQLEPDHPGLSADELAAAFRRSAELLTQEADEICRYVAQRRAY